MPYSILKPVRAATIVALLLIGLWSAERQVRAANFTSNWNTPPDRVSIGPEYWANPMEHWLVRDGAIECITAGPNRCNFDTSAFR